MPKKNDIIAILSVLFGLFASVEVFTYWLGMPVVSIVIITAIGGTISLLKLIESISIFNKAVAVLGLVLNMVPLGYIIFLYFVL
ncbi:hypothetical protein AB1I62_08715 [Enterococcus sp. AN402]|uniref:hypothetical protein n=1 Tax=Enterococcus sp. AN402 TaxID=3151386 RepID=UPI003457C741